LISNTSESRGETTEQIENEIRCGAGTHLENNLCVPDKKTSSKQTSSTLGLKNGQWVKYQITTIDVQSSSTMFSAAGFQQAIAEALIPTDEEGNQYFNTDWFKVTIENPSNSKYTTVTSVGLPSGEEKFLISKTFQLGTEDFLPLAISTNLKEGDKITIGNLIYEIKDSQLTVGGKKLEVLQLLAEERKSDVGVVTDLRIEALYHKYTGMSLLIDAEAQASGGGEFFSMVFGFHAIEVSDHFLEKPTLSIGGGGCLIATATYGSELVPQVQMLREIRDNSLLQTQSGQSFMKSFNQFYYSFSPVIADYERQNPVFKEAVKLTITPLLASLSLLNYVDLDSEESVLGYGIGIILMNIGMYFVAPVMVIHRIKKILNSKLNLESK